MWLSLHALKGTARRLLSIPSSYSYHLLIRWSLIGSMVQKINNRSLAPRAETDYWFILLPTLCTFSMNDETRVVDLPCERVTSFSLAWGETLARWEGRGFVTHENEIIPFPKPDRNTTAEIVRPRDCYSMGELFWFMSFRKSTALGAQNPTTGRSVRSFLFDCQ